MKRFIIMLALLYAGVVKGQSSGVTITGVVKNLEGHQLAFAYDLNGKRMRDTVATMNGYFSHTVPIRNAGEISIFPYKYYKNAMNVRGRFNVVAPFLVIYTQPSDKVIVDGDAMKLWEAKITGENNMRDYDALNTILRPKVTKHYKIMKEYYAKDSKRDTTGIKKLLLDAAAVRAAMATDVKNFTDTNRSSYSLFLLNKNRRTTTLEELKNVLATYPKEMQQSKVGTQLSTFIQNSENVAVGKGAINFSGTGLDNKLVSTASLRGKYVMLDFWGSWCQPCRMSHPHLREIYAKYKSKGLEIIGIAQEMSVDARGTWTKAVKEDKLDWPQLLNKDFKEKNEDLIKAYNVDAFPTKILLDKEGKIIWKMVGGGGKELDTKMEELFGG